MEQGHRLHVIANPIIPTDPNICTDPFNIKIIKFCRMFHRRGHYIIFYGVNECKNMVQCSEYHGIIGINEYDEAKRISNNFTHPNYMLIDNQDICGQISQKMWNKFGELLIPHLNTNYKKGDIVIHMVDDYAPSNFNCPMIHIDGGKGGGYYSIYKNAVFETYEYMKTFYKYLERNKEYCKIHNQKIIYPWFYPEDFTFNPDKRDNTYLYMARCQKYKGLHIFLHLSTLINATFIIAGGCASWNPQTKILETGEIQDGKVVTFDLNLYPNVKYIGIADYNTRKHLLSTVKALIQPTQYIEPCGWNVIESMMCGTPVLVSSFGGFLDTVIHGKTGFMCEFNVHPSPKLYDEWIKYIDKLDGLDPYVIRQYAIDKFSEDNAYQKYLQLFSQAEI